MNNQELKQELICIDKVQKKHRITIHNKKTKNKIKRFKSLDRWIRIEIGFWFN